MQGLVRSARLSLPILHHSAVPLNVLEALRDPQAKTTSAGLTFEFSGTAEQEIATVTAVNSGIAPGVSVGDVVVKVDPRYHRPADVETLLGDTAKAKIKLGWVPETTVEEMCAEMVASDLNAARQHTLLQAHGHQIAVARE